MPTLSLSARDISTVKADAIVVGVARTSSGPRLLPSPLPDAAQRRLQATLAALGVTGTADAVHRVPSAAIADGLSTPVVAVTGVGPLAASAAPTLEALRRAAGAATRSLAGLGTVVLALPTPDAAHVAAVAEGGLLGAYAFGRYRSTTSSPDRAPVGAVVVHTTDARGRDARAAARRAETLSAAVHATRDLINAAPADLYPASFADEAVAAVAGLPITVTVLDEKKLAKGGYGGLLGVGMGSTRPPRLVRLDYAPARAKHHLALVGKGITFDSGGLSIKTASGMETMKCDMSGAAGVLHTIVAAARLEVPVRLSGWLALAENMPSGTAQRPSDVLTIRGGRTVEVLNTDAEGRLVLADALAAASETYPDLMVDVATLTGAQTVALGNRVSAIMANDDDLRSRVHRLSEAAGEQFWPMPLPAELRPSLDSAVADLANMGDRFGGMLVAGLFLAEFVGPRQASTSAPTSAATRGRAGARAVADAAEATKDAAKDAPRIPWAHLDIAGPAFNTGSAHGYTPVGGTGVAVRTLLALAEDVAARGV